ncbi:hypothetical protein [Trinickia terrae]|nr:hypothetical protein [Trinickia terrae]
MNYERRSFWEAGAAIVLGLPALAFHRTNTGSLRANSWISAESGKD